MANAWIANNFFTVPTASYSEAEALGRAVNNIESAQGQDSGNYLYNVYLDLKYLRFGIVFSQKSFNALKGWGLLTGDEVSYLMEFPKMIQATLTGTLPAMIEGVGLSEDAVLELIRNNDQVGISEERAVELFSGMDQVGMTPDEVRVLIGELDQVGLTEERARAIVAEMDQVGISVAEARALVLELDQVGMTYEEVVTLIQELDQQGMSEPEVRALITGLDLTTFDEARIKDLVKEYQFSPIFVQSVVEQITEQVELPTKQEVLNEASALASAGLNNEEIKQAVIQLKNAQIPISAADVVTEVKQTVTQEVVGELDLQQAQNDVVRGAIDYLTTDGVLSDIEQSAQIGAFRTVLTNLTQQIADITAAYEAGGSLEININTPI